jgi:hypothetical protein
LVRAFCAFADGLGPAGRCGREALLLTLNPLLLPVIGSAFGRVPVGLERGASALPIPKSAAVSGRELSGFLLLLLSIVLVIFS